ncbi:hypothetical protein T06_14559 [Trichinella sp. T6]|nr:hypothetical protein T06_14559 [Trichinella sp. T6]KRX71017.1 hypothetical protein T06_14559 [Trichinella sp. T6]
MAGNRLAAALLPSSPEMDERKESSKYAGAFAIHELQKVSYQEMGWLFLNQQKCHEELGRNRCKIAVIVYFVAVQQLHSCFTQLNIPCTVRRSGWQDRGDSAHSTLLTAIDRKARKIFIKGSTITSNVSADSDEIVEEKIVEKLVEETQANADIERKLQALDRLKKLNFDFKSKHGINPLATVPLKQNLVHVVEYRSEGDRLFVNEPNCRGLNKDERLDLKTKSRTLTDETSQHERRISSKRTSHFNDDEFQSLQEKHNLHLETSNTSGNIFQQTYFGTSVYPGSNYFDDRQHDHNSTTLHSMIYKAELFGESCESPFISTPPIGFVEAWLPFVPLSFQQGIPNIGPCVELNSQLIPEQRAEMETGQRVADNEVEVTKVLDKEDLAAFRKILHDFRKKKSSQLQKKVSYNCDENTCLNLQLMKDSCLPMAELKSMADVVSAQTPKLRCAVTLDKDQSRRLFHSANLLVPDLKIYYSNCEQSYRKKHQRHLFFYGDPTMISMSNGKVVSASKGKALEKLFATLSKKASQLLISVPRYEMSPRYQALCCMFFKGYLNGVVDSNNPDLKDVYDGRYPNSSKDSSCADK